MTWTRNGEPLGPEPRPWRLTRRQRVEMEAALARLRPHVRRRHAHEYGAPVRAALFDFGLSPLDADRTIGAATRTARSFGRDYMDAIRILRARVAIALRAALRADEDARCEATDDLRDTVGSDVDDVLDRVREWPALRPITAMQWVESGDVSEDGGDATAHSRLPIPLALWERAR